MEQLSAEWGYTTRGKRDGEFRSLTQEEHDLLIQQRAEETKRLEQVVQHTKATIELAQTGDPKAKQETVTMIVEGLESLQEVSKEIGFDQLVRRLHVGSPFKDGYLASAVDTLELTSKFPGRLCIPRKRDILGTINRRVSPYGFDIANVDAWFRE